MLQSQMALNPHLVWFPDHMNAKMSRHIVTPPIEGTPLQLVHKINAAPLPILYPWIEICTVQQGVLVKNTKEMIWQLGLKLIPENLESIKFN